MKAKHTHKQANPLPIPVLFLLFVLTFGCLRMQAQDAPNIEHGSPAKVHELGLVFDNFSVMGMTYRVGTESCLWRFSVPEISLSLFDKGQDEIAFEKSSINATVALGREWRRPLGKQLLLRTGFDVSLGYAYSKRQYSLADQVTQSLNPGVNAVVGVGYLVKGKLMLGGEFNPGLVTGIRFNASRRASFPTQNYYQASAEFQFNLLPMLSACLRF